MRLDRLVSIIMILLDKKRIPAQELADKFEVSLRTIYRDIDAIDIAGIPIRSIPGVGGGFEIMPKYKVDSNVFSRNDLSSILLGLSSVSGIVQSDTVIHALEKVKTLIPDEHARDIEFKANQIHIDMSPWIGNIQIQNNLEVIKQALHAVKLVTFSYRDHRGNITERTVEPYQLVLKSNRWYCHSYCLTKKDYRLFRLSRISNVRTLSQSFDVRAYDKPRLDFDDRLETIQTKVKIRIHKSLVDRVLDFCTFDYLIEDGDAHYILEFPFIENDFYYNTILSFGNKCECLSPAHIRAEVINRIDAILAIYI